MTLTTETAKSTRSLTYFVRIYTTVGTYSGANVLVLPVDPTSADGVPGIESIRISKSFDSPVPVCQLELSRVPAWIRRGMGVTVDVGYNGLTQRLFTGFIQSRERKVGRGTLQCMGRLWTAFRTVQIGDRDVDGITVSTAIGNILDYVGLTDNRSLTVPSFTLGTASSPVLSRMPASQMLQMLMDIDGCRIYETGTGQVVVRVIDEAPAATAFKTYTSNDNATARVLEASDREDPEYYRNRVIVTGATITEGTAPDQTSRTISATATNTGSALVQPALPSGTYIDAEYNNHLIDTDAKAAEVAIRLLTKFARIPRQLQIELAGDPELDLGQTIAFVMPEIDLNDRGFVSGIEHVIDSNGYVTRLTDFRGAGDTGGTLSQNPVAAFTFKSEVEVFGSTTNVFAALDASNSFDPDGTIASYAWSDNQTTTPEIATLTTQQVTVRADTSAWTGDWNVTLTVTDNSGLTGSTTVKVPYKNTDPEIVMPAMYAAINNRHSASLDRGITWNDSTVGSGNSISVGARPADGVNVGHACFGTSTGRIYRTTDGAATVTLVYTTAAAVAINDILWDWRNGNVVWAIDENCIVYISVDAGVTWTIYNSLRTTLSLAGALGNKLGLPAGGGVYIFGGTGAGSPLIAYDPVVGSQQWTRPTLTGDIKTDTVDTPGDATLRIIDYTAGWTKECLIIAWSSGGGASITSIYSATTPPFANSWAFTRASTTFGGLKTGKYVVSDNVAIKSDYFIAAFANRSVWYSTDGVAWTEVTNVMPVGVTPNHAIGMTGSQELTGIVGMFGVFMIAASDGIYKYTPRIDSTASYIRGGTGAGTAWPASAVGKRLSIGASGAAVAGVGRLAIVKTGAPAKISYLSGGAVWAEVSLPANIDGPRPQIYPITSTNWVVCDSDGYTDTTTTANKASYTNDGGATWADAAIGDEAGGADPKRGLTRITKGASGRIWGARVAGDDTTDPIRCHVYYSDNLGVTWTLDTTLAVGGQRRYPLRLIAHPTDSNIVALLISNADASNKLITHIRASGGSWSTNQVASTPTADPSNAIIGKGAAMLSTGRIIFTLNEAPFGTPDTFCYTSDDSGATYTLRQTIANTDHFGILAGASLTKIVLFRPNVNALTADSYAYVSLDSGLSYTATGTALPAPTATGSDWSAKYDAATDTLYVVNGNDAAGAQRVYSFTPVSSAGAWTDITYNLASGGSAWDSLGVVPA
jgi:hypothetical protein